MGTRRSRRGSARYSPPPSTLTIRPRGMGLGHGHNRGGQRLEVLDLQAQVADRVFGMRVEPRADEDQLRAVLVGELLQGVRKAAR